MENNETGRCPFCGAEDVEEYENGTCECYVCGESWQVTYYTPANRYTPYRRPKKKISDAQKKKDEEFHKEYLRWKKNNGYRIRQLMEETEKPAPKEPIPEPDYHEYYMLVRIVAGLIFYSFLIFVLIRSCDS